MKILAYIPVNEIKTQNTTQQISEIREVECVAITRSPVSYNNKELNRFHYSALIIPHIDCIAKEYLLNKDGYLHVNIVRKLNKKWKPPVFEKDKHIFYY